MLSVQGDKFFSYKNFNKRYYSNCWCCYFCVVVFFWRELAWILRIFKCIQHNERSTWNILQGEKKATEIYLDGSVQPELKSTKKKTEENTHLYYGIIHILGNIVMSMQKHARICPKLLLHDQLEFSVEQTIFTGEILHTLLISICNFH